jgi:DNA-directed RNA polymerase subunit RPC12/RpoP
LTKLHNAHSSGTIYGQSKPFIFIFLQGLKMPNLTIECPECGKSTVVQPKENVYQCLGCNFKRDFSKPRKPKANIGIRMVAVFAALLSFLLLRAIYAPSGTATNEVESSPTSKSYSRLN